MFTLQNKNDTQFQIKLDPVFSQPVATCFTTSTFIPVPKNSNVGLNDFRPVALTSDVMTFGLLIMRLTGDLIVDH